MAKSQIEWTEATWNPLTGCSKISPGCKNCYAERMAKRLKAMGQYNYRNEFELTMHEHALSIPTRSMRPQMIFVNSMSDLFHEAVPLSFIKKVFSVMNSCQRHTFQVLTKRSERLKKFSRELNWTDNIWMGVSVENSDYKFRITDLQKTNAKVKFISFEPLLGSIQNLHLDNIHWAIVGGESGPGARPMKPEWVSSIKNQCIRQNVLFFFKQWGGTNKKKNGRLLEGRTWDDVPEVNMRQPFCH